MKQSSFFNKKSKGFTLAEVLVVVAVIGLLSSIVLISTKRARGKARVAGGLQFEAQVYHALGAYSAGLWDFDDQTANDASGYDNHGTVYGATFTDDTPSGTGYALSFDGVGDYVEIPDSSSLNPTKGITITVWVYADSSCPKTILYKGPYASATTKGYNIYIIGDPNPDRWISFDFGTVDGTSPRRVRYRTTGLENVLPLNRWVFLAFTYASSDLAEDAKIYIDGRATKSFRDPSWTQEMDAGGDLNPSTEPLLIGNDSGTTCFLKTDNVRIYEVALTQAQIKKLYVEGAKKRGLLTSE